MKLVKLFFLFSLIFSLNSCVEYDNIEFKGIENFKMGNMTKDAVDFTLDVSIFNPNKYNIVVKPSTVDVFVEDIYIGKGNLRQKVKMIKGKTNIYSVPINLELEKGTMLKLMAFALKKEVEINVKGKVKAGAFGLSKKFDIDEKEKLSLRDFKLR